MVIFLFYKFELNYKWIFATDKVPENPANAGLDSYLGYIPAPSAIAKNNKPKIKQQ